MTPDQQIPDLLTFLLSKYQVADLGELGEEAHQAPLDVLYAKLKTPIEQAAAMQALQDFLEFGQRYLADHPPQQQIMLDQGFGMALAGGDVVSLVPSQYPDMGHVEDAGDVPVTLGMSVRGQRGIVAGAQVPVFGGPRRPA
jgi:hypothetical protein